ncbi:HRSL1 enzyme, partial [Menura novaehollandiae]|nr:HRSL1 enzyme [Menura novaehollandiae]
LIEIDRPLYQHGVLYVGDGYVINVTPADKTGAPPLSVTTVSLFTRKVKKQLLKEVVGNDKWSVNNEYDHSRTTVQLEEIIWRAECYIDMEMTYDVLGNNCEHLLPLLLMG